MLFRHKQMRYLEVNNFNRVCICAAYERSTAEYVWYDDIGEARTKYQLESYKQKNR